MASPALTDLLATLAANDVELIVVGGLAAVAQGAAIPTHDLDIVPRRTDDNVARLLHVLGELDAATDVIHPTAESLAGTGHSLLMTKLGPLDVLGAIEGGRDYDVLEPRSLLIEVAGKPVRVLGLDMIVELKRASTHPKDKRVLPELEAALARSRQR